MRYWVLGERSQSSQEHKKVASSNHRTDLSTFIHTNPVAVAKLHSFPLGISFNEKYNEVTENTDVDTKNIIKMK